jgi:hypothetical protein
LTGATLPSSPFTCFSIISMHENYDVSENDIHRNERWWRLTCDIPYTC